MNQQVIDFKKFWKTTEFGGTAVFLSGLFGMQFFTKDLTGWAVATAIVSGSYVISRGEFKKNRNILIGHGEKTSEFYVSIVGILSILIQTWIGNVELGIGLVAAAVIQAALNKSRGHAKSLTPKAQVHMIGA